MAKQKYVFQEALTQFHSSITNNIAATMETYRRPTRSNDMHPPQVETIANAMHRIYPGVFTEIQLVLLLIREWERLQVRYEEYLLREDMLFHRETPPRWQALEEVACPFCDFLRLSRVPDSHGERVECAQCDDGIFDRDVLDV